jgi:murein DD-endopeptidase MepM/ murein hydrolase activator NlpD
LLNSYRHRPLICHNPANSENYDSFVIPDYKIRKKAGPIRRRGRHHVVVAAAVLAATLGTVRFLDLNTSNTDLIATADASPVLVSTHLALPGTSLPRAETEQFQTTKLAQQTSGTGVAQPATEHPPTELLGTGELPARPSDADAGEPSLLAGIDRRKDRIEAAADTPAQETNLVDTTPVAAPATDSVRWNEHEIVSGESLASIFKAQGLEPALLHRIINSGKQAKSLAKIRPGQTLRFRFDDEDLTTLELQRNRVDSLRIAIADDDIRVEQISKAVDNRVASAAGIIESSLFLDGQKAGLSDGVIMDLATIFGWDIDFALEIRAGDQFRVLYEEQYLDGEKLSDGAILAAEFTNRGKTYTAVRYEDRNGEIGYFDAEGNSKRRAFIRSPIKFARVSSRYNPKRWHPVLMIWRSHKGVDYAAPRGTPIRATGDGRVVHRGTKGGYGRAVIIEHAGKYTTLYAHMSKYSRRAKKGARVKQGQVIGYVGKSGLATGPHLHYEFRVHGKHRDPLRVKLPKSLSLPKSEIANFRKTATPLLTQLAAIPADTMLASAEVNGTP